MSVITRDTFPLLVADMGGTNVRFGWIAHAGAPLSAVETLLCADYPRPEDAAQAYLRAFHAGARPAHAALAIASAVSPGAIKVTNSHWILERAGFAAHVGANGVQVFNDFEAIALVLPHLTADDYSLVGTAVPDPRFPMGVIGPGTGLGVAGVLPIRGRPGAWQTICGEGGHVTLAAATPYQSEILRAARQVHEHVSAEKLVSGIGLPTLLQAVATVNGLRAERDLVSEEIGTLGASRADPLCEKTMEAFCSLLGSIAGNLALTLGARGGVFIAGGIVPKLGEFFAQSGFREHFEAKGRYVDYLRVISTPVITAPNPGLLGLAHNAIQETVIA
ncbi:MAG: glucokinase [Betaproteobacteria bacterium]